MLGTLKKIYSSLAFLIFSLSKCRAETACPLDEKISSTTHMHQGKNAYFISKKNAAPVPLHTSQGEKRCCTTKRERQWRVKYLRTQRARTFPGQREFWGAANCDKWSPRVLCENKESLSLSHKSAGLVNSRETAFNCASATAAAVVIYQQHSKQIFSLRFRPRREKMSSGAK